MRKHCLEVCPFAGIVLSNLRTPPSWTLIPTRPQIHTHTMFPSRITSPLPSQPQQEDIFSAALSSLFTDDVQNSHGVPGSHVTYHSPLFGDVELRIPKHPDVEEGRKLFAHYLWNAGVICADAIEEASREGGNAGHVEGEELEDERRGRRQ